MCIIKLTLLKVNVTLGWLSSNIEKIKEVFRPLHRTWYLFSVLRYFISGTFTPLLWPFKSISNLKSFFDVSSWISSIRPNRKASLNKLDIFFCFSSSRSWKVSYFFSYDVQLPSSRIILSYLFFSVDNEGVNSIIFSYSRCYCHYFNELHSP